MLFSLKTEQSFREEEYVEDISWPFKWSVTSYKYH